MLLFLKETFETVSYDKFYFYENQDNFADAQMF